MKSAILFLSVFLFSITGYSQQSAQSYPDPHVFYDKGVLHIEPSIYKIVSYEVSLLRKHSTGDVVGPYTYITGGPSVDALHLIQLAQQGDKLFFEEIKVKGPGGRVRSVSPITIIMK